MLKGSFYPLNARFAKVADHPREAPTPTFRLGVDLVEEFVAPDNCGYAAVAVRSVAIALRGVGDSSAVVFDDVWGGWGVGH